MRRSIQRSLFVGGAGAFALVAVTAVSSAQDAPMRLGAPTVATVAPPAAKPTVVAPRPPARPTRVAVGTTGTVPQKKPTSASLPTARPAAKSTASAKPAAPKPPKPDAAAARAALLAKMTGQVVPPTHHHVFETVKPNTCPGNPNAIGVSRVMKVDTTGGFYVGQTYHTRLPLEPKEVVLTFDDGPMNGRTERVLAALEHECTRATFFIVGQMAKAYPETLRRTAAAGNTIGYHTMTHPLNMVKWPLEKAQANVRDGWQTVDQILYGKAGDKPATPFFRYPGLFNSRALDEWFNGMDMGVYAIDAAGNDWLKGYITLTDGPNVMNRALSELEARQGGILLLHDIKDSSSSIVAPLLVELKKRGFKIVHIVPKTAPPQLVTGPIKGVLPTVAETTVPVEQRGIDGYDVAKRLAQQGAGHSGKTATTALPTYEAARSATESGAAPAVRNAAYAAVAPTTVEPVTTGSVPAAAPRTDEGWFTSTATSFRGVASAIGLW